MKANAPEKLYLSNNIYSTYLYQVPDPDDETSVEYTRTDAFIEKACEWLEPVFKNYAGYNCGMDLVEDFRKYMEGE